MSLLRKEQAINALWNLTPLYKDDAEWESSFKIYSNPEKMGSLNTFKGHLNEGATQLKALFDLYFSLQRAIEKLYTFAHLKHDEDISNETYKKMQEKALILLQHYSEESAWIEPELFSLKDEVLKAYLKDPILESYHFHLEKLIAVKAHILSFQEEKILALASRAMQTPHKAFSSLNNADFRFPKVEDQKGSFHELTHALYSLYLQNRDRTLRKNSFYAMHSQFASYQNTLADLLQGEMLVHQFEAKARNYASSLEAALKPKNIDLSVYTSLVEGVKNNLAPLHDYLELRKTVLGVETLHFYDLHLPLTKELDISLSYEEAEDLVIDSVAILGKEYQTFLSEGLKKKGWVDRYENQNKRSGAYSSGCYDSEPYILMNFKGALRDLFTLGHECGHSMHSLYSHKNQPYHYSSYSIFVAEVASTFNEELLFQQMLSRAKTKEEKIYHLTSRLDDIRSTLFRQTLFADFELKIHQMVENNEPLTPEALNTLYHSLNTTYYGKVVTLDEISQVEWARIPHFYYNFYVYQYATGISAALFLASKVLKGGKKEVDAYLSFLKGGCSRYPIDLLKLAGVDMCTTEPVAGAIAYFAELLAQLKRELGA